MPDTIYSLDQVEELLRSVAGHADRDPFAALVPEVGSEFMSGRELMVVGRATNGWAERTERAFKLDEIDDPASRRCFAERTLRFVRADPLAWVNRYGPGSPFWRVARKVAGGLGIGGDLWYRRIAWSNLYKAVPAAKRGPSGSLMEAQREVCRRLLCHEIACLAPRRILFLVGCGNGHDWFRWFDAPLGFIEAGQAEVAGHAIRWGTIAHSNVVVLPHPQGKPEGKLAEAALQCLGLRKRSETEEP